MSDLHKNAGYSHEFGGEWVDGLEGGGVLARTGSQGNGQGVVLGQRVAFTHCPGSGHGPEEGAWRAGVEEHIRVS